MTNLCNSFVCTVVISLTIQLPNKVATAAAAAVVVVIVVVVVVVVVIVTYALKGYLCKEDICAEL